MTNIVPMARTDMKEIAVAKEWGKVAKQAGIIPSDMNEIQAAVIVQTGREIGLQPLQSLRSMAFIKGRITMTVQLQLALARQSGVVLEKLEETAGKCEATLRREKEVVTCCYTMDDAKKAGLFRAGGAYEKYEKQMLRWRAIGDALRLLAPDLVMGLLSPEEAISIEPETAEEIPQSTPPEETEPVAGDDPVPDAGDGSHLDVSQTSVPYEQIDLSEAFETPGGGDTGKGKRTAKPPKNTDDLDPPPMKIKKGIQGFLQSMAWLKGKAYGYSGSDDAYYKVLASFSVKHSNEIKDVGMMKTVYLAMRARVIELRDEANVEGGKDG